MQEQLHAPGVETGNDPLHRAALCGVELDRPGRRADRGAGRAPAHLAPAELDQAAALEPQQRVAADAGRGELAGAEPFGARRQQPERAALDRPEPAGLDRLCGAPWRRAVVSVRAAV